MFILILCNLDLLKYISPGFAPVLSLVIPTEPELWQWRWRTWFIETQAVLKTEFEMSNPKSPHLPLPPPRKHELSFSWMDNSSFRFRLTNPPPSPSPVTKACPPPTRKWRPEFLIENLDFGFEVNKLDFKFHLWIRSARSECQLQLPLLSSL